MFTDFRAQMIGTYGEFSSHYWLMNRCFDFNFLITLSIIAVTISCNVLCCILLQNTTASTYVIFSYT